MPFPELHRLVCKLDIKVICIVTKKQQQKETEGSVNIRGIAFAAIKRLIHCKSFASGLTNSSPPHPHCSFPHKRKTDAGLRSRKIISIGSLKVLLEFA
ncbi:hypothetical protein CEXT_59301 [Caerostris extrusa]|uniref:Uncharacterized protein n=1 Tax=Caerostris extrusa TaxID=172846 RepID=A0AAV4MCC0_CAEEX|nr:hypothetical protein CEXT_59301 [Caerostris extrusa]